MYTCIFSMLRLRHFAPSTISLSRQSAFIGRVESFHTTVPARTGRVVEVLQDDFEKKVLKAKEPVIVDFHAEWCPPCKVLGPILTEAVTTNGKTTLAKIDVDNSPTVASQYRISSVPTVIAFHRGQPVEHFVGAQPKAFVGEFVSRIGNLAEK